MGVVILRRLTCSLLAAVLVAAFGARLLPEAAKADAAGQHTFDMYDAGSVRYQQPDNTACVATAALMMLDMAAHAHDPELDGFRWTPTVLYSVQEQMLAYARAHDTTTAPTGSDPHGWRNLMNRYGWGSTAAGVYVDRAYSDFDSALRATVLAVATYHLPVGLLMEAGFHAELVTGYSVSGADPATGSSAFTVDGLYLTDPFQAHGHRDYYATYAQLRSTGTYPVRFVPYTQRDSLLRDPIDGQVGVTEWYGKYVIVLPVKQTAPWPLPTQATAQPPLGAGPATFVPLGPTRVLDTRAGLGLSGPLTDRRSRTLAVAGTLGVPADAVAVTVNVTIVDQTAGGWLALTPTPTAAPDTSVLNVPRGDTRANGATVPLAADGSLSLSYGATTGATTDVVLDVTGAYVADRKGAGYAPLGPTRVLDTRVDLGLDGQFEAGSSRALQVAGLAGVPADATAVAVNVTVTDQSAAGFIALTPEADDAPATSTLNFPVADDRANNAIVPLGGAGTIGITYVAPPGATADIVLDVTGAFVPGSGLRFTPIAPTRLVDTRIDLGLTYDFVSREARTVTVAGVAGVPSEATAVVANLTSVRPTEAGYLALTSDPQDDPATSTLNFPAGDIRANGATAPLAAGSIGITYAATPDTFDDVVLDVTGYFSP